MAKKKKKTTKANSQTRKENSHSVSGQRKELVQRVYNYSSKEISRRLPESGSRLRMGMDFDAVRLKRRVAATLATLEELTKQVPDIAEEVPEIFHLAEDWAQLNAIAAPAYDCEEEENTATLGAAIWMLDQIRETGRIQDAIRLMPKDDGPLDQIYIPPVWDPCHSDEVLLGMLYIIQNRNQDCVGPKDPRPTKEKPAQLERFYMDLLTAEGKHHQNVDSRIRFETILSMIPQDSIDRAVQHYQELFWNWVQRYYTCRNIILQKEIQLDLDRKAYNDQLRSDTDDLIQWMKKDIAKRREIVEGKLPIVSDQRPAYIHAMETPMADIMRLKANMDAKGAALDERSDEIEDCLTSLQSMIRFLHTSSFQRMGDELGDDIASVWQGIRVDDPYEILFAHLYLLDTDSDLPWVYAPGTSIFALAANSLPWSHCDYDDECDGIWNHYDEEIQDVVCGPADANIPKKVKIPELEDWYSMNYSDRTFEDRYGHNRFNLAQIIFEITGGIMPRNLNRYLPALSDLEHFGITGKKALHPLMYVMSLLGEGRRQSRDWRLEGETHWDKVDAAGNLLEPEEPEEAVTSPEALEAKIAELKKQLEHARKTAYDANREMRECKKRQEKLEKKLAMEQQELADLRELVFHQQENLYQDAVADENVRFPYKTTLRTVVFGGHDSWAREIKPKLPDVRFIDRTMLPNSDMIRRADVVWIQTNALSHAFFYKIIDEVRKHNVPLRYFSYASATKCAEQLAKYDEENCT